MCLALAACGSSPTIEDTYFSLVLEAADEPTTENGDAELTLRLTNVSLPEFLLRRNLAIQTGGNEIKAANHHYWAEPLDEAIAKVLVRDIEAANQGIAVHRYNGSGDCELAIEFDRFHASADGRVLVSGRYWLAASEPTRHAFDVSRPLDGQGYGAAVTSLRASLGTLGAEIAGSIAQTGACKPADSD